MEYWILNPGFLPFVMLDTTLLLSFALERIFLLICSEELESQLAWWGCNMDQSSISIYLEIFLFYIQTEFQMPESRRCFLRRGKAHWNCPTEYWTVSFRNSELDSGGNEKFVGDIAQFDDITLMILAARCLAEINFGIHLFYIWSSSIHSWVSGEVECDFIHHLTHQEQTSPPGFSSSISKPKFGSGTIAGLKALPRSRRTISRPRAVRLRSIRYPPCSLLISMFNYIRTCFVNCQLYCIEVKILKACIFCNFDDKISNLDKLSYRPGKTTVVIEGKFLVTFKSLQRTGYVVIYLKYDPIPTDSTTRGCVLGH